MKSILLKLIAGIVIAAMLSGVSLFIYQMLDEQDTETLARSFPANTDIFISVTTETPLSTALHFRAITNRAGNLEQRLKQAIEQDIAEPFEIDTNNIIAWVGKEVAIGMSSEDRHASIIVNVKDKDRAETTIMQIANRMSDTGLTEHTEIRIGTFDVWVHPTLLSYALSDDLLILTDSGALETIMSVVEGQRPSLHDTLDFQTARENMISGCFASMFIRPGPVLNNGFTNNFLPVSALPTHSLPAWVGASAVWRGEGILFNLAAPDSDAPRTRPDDAEATRAFTKNPASLAPAETSLLLAFGFDPNVDNWRKALAELDNLPASGDIAVPWQPIQAPDISGAVEDDGLVAGF